MVEVYYSSRVMYLVYWFANYVSTDPRYYIESGPWRTQSDFINDGQAEVNV